MTQTAALVVFTRAFSELVQRGVPVRSALSDIIAMHRTQPKIRRIAAEVAAGIEEGRTLSSVFASCTAVTFPQWYTSFIGVAEENDCLSETCAFLTETLQMRQKSVATFARAMVYPALVVVLCLACSICATLLFPHIFANDVLAYRNGAAGSFFFASLFLLAVIFFATCVLKTVTQMNPCISLMHALAFLTTRGASLSESLQCAVPIVEKHERLCGAVLGIRACLLRGENIVQAFSEQLEYAGYAAAAHAVATNLTLAQASGGRNVFARTAEMLAQKAETLRSSVLSCEQPVLLCCAAVYMLILLKNTLLPYMTSMGV